MTSNQQLFLERDDVRILTGRCQKSLQIAQLRKMGIPFNVNFSGAPIVARSAVEGGKPVQAPAKWRPAVLGT